MALTKAQVREILSAAGVDREHMSDAVDKIIDGHLASINVLREEADKYKGDAEKLPGVQKELDDLKAAGDGGYKEKYEKEHRDFENYKSGVEAKRTRAAKEKAAMEYLKSKGVQDANLNIALRSLSAEIDAAELDGDKIKDTSAFDTLLAGDLKGIVTTVTEVGGGNPANPPKNPGKAMSREEIYKKDDKGRYVLSAAERKKAIAENHEQFGI